MDGCVNAYFSEIFMSSFFRMRSNSFALIRQWSLHKTYEFSRCSTPPPHLNGGTCGVIRFSREVMSSVEAVQIGVRYFCTLKIAVANDKKVEHILCSLVAL